MILGDRSRLPFLLLLSLRSHLVQNRALAVFTIIAIATSVALATALEMSGRSVQAELERTAEALVGAAELEVTAGTLGIPEELLARVKSVPGVLAASPLIQVTFRIADGRYEGQPLRVLGLDLLADAKVRRYTITRGDLEIRDPLRLVSRLDSIIVTADLASRLGIGLGESFRIRSSAGELGLTVRGVLGPGGIADAYGRQVAVMDVYSLQTLLGREGWFDRIDIVPEGSADLRVLKTSIRKQVAGIATVRDASARDAFLERALGTVKQGVWVLTMIGMLVAAFLSYGTISMSVDRRTRWFALLQSVGVEASGVRRTVMIDVLVIAALGSGVGFPIGIRLSDIFVSAFAGTLEYLQNVNIESAGVNFSTIGVAISVGLVVSFLAGLAPARRATARAPLEVLRGATGTDGERRPSSMRILALGGFALACGIFVFAPAAVPATLRVGMTFVAGVALLVIVFGPLLLPLLQLIGPTLATAFPRIGALVGSSLAYRPSRTALTVALLASVVAALTAILVTLESISETFGDWALAHYPNGVLVTAGDPFGGADLELIRAETKETIEKTPGVKAVLEVFTYSRLLYREEEVMVTARSMDVMAEHGGLPIVTGGDTRSISAALLGGDIAISESFEKKFGLSVGDSLKLDTPKGSRDFMIAGVLRDYAGITGKIYFDVATFDGLWPRSGSYSMIIWTEGERDVVLDRIRARVVSAQPVFFIYGDEIRRYATQLIEESVSLLYVIAGLTSLLAGVGVLNMLIDSVVGRRRELALLRAAGGTSLQLGVLVFLDGSLIAGIGSVMGVGFGLVCALPMRDVLAESLGWSLQFAIDWAEIGLLGLGVFVGVTATALYPAWAARGVGASELLCVD